MQVVVFSRLELLVEVLCSFQANEISKENLVVDDSLEIHILLDLTLGILTQL